MLIGKITHAPVHVFHGPAGAGHVWDCEPCACAGMCVGGRCDTPAEAEGAATVHATGHGGIIRAVYYLQGRAS